MHTSRVPAISDPTPVFGIRPLTSKQGLVTQAHGAGQVWERVTLANPKTATRDVAMPFKGDNKHPDSQGPGRAHLPAAARL